MFIKQSMTGKIVTIGKNADIFEAQEKMGLHHIRHLPVVEDDHHLIGIVSDRDIRGALPYGPLAYFDFRKEKERLLNLKIDAIMTRDPYTISPLDTIEDALLLIQSHKVGALPVVEENRRLVGIISVRDLLRAFISVMGIEEPGTLLGILLNHKHDRLKGIVDAVSEENISIGSILVARHWDKNKRAVFPYLLTQNVAPIKRKLEKKGYTLLNPMDWYLDRLPEDP
jgi:acetoin utilization protein AcuB